MPGDRSKRSRQSWDPTEDEAVRKSVARLGAKKWTAVAQLMHQEFGVTNKSGKQARERWQHHLAPEIEKKPWSMEDDILLFESQKKLGNCWADIAKLLPGRTDNCVKNRFYSTLRKTYRKVKGCLVGSSGMQEELPALSALVQNSLAVKLARRCRAAKKSKAVKTAKSPKPQKEPFTDSPDPSILPSPVSSPLLWQAPLHALWSFSYSAFLANIHAV